MHTVKQRRKLSEILPHGFKSMLAAKLKVAPGNIPGILDKWGSENSRRARLLAIELSRAFYLDALEQLEEYRTQFAPNGANVAQ